MAGGSGFSPIVFRIIDLLKTKKKRGGRSDLVRVSIEREPGSGSTGTMITIPGVDEIVPGTRDDWSLESWECARFFEIAGSAGR